MTGFSPYLHIIHYRTHKGSALFFTWSHLMQQLKSLDKYNIIILDLHTVTDVTEWSHWVTVWLIVATSRPFIWCIVRCYSRLFISLVHSFIHFVFIKYIFTTYMPNFYVWLCFCAISDRLGVPHYYYIYMVCSRDNKVRESPRIMEQVSPVCSPAAQCTCQCGRSQDRQTLLVHGEEWKQWQQHHKGQETKRREWARRQKEHIQIQFTLAGLFALRHVEGTKPCQDKQVCGVTFCSVCRRVSLFFPTVLLFIRGT